LRPFEKHRTPSPPRHGHLHKSAPGHEHSLSLEGERAGERVKVALIATITLSPTPLSSRERGLTQTCMDADTLKKREFHRDMIFQTAS
jgi:hypothetical protein